MSLNNLDDKTRVVVDLLDLVFKISYNDHPLRKKVSASGSGLYYLYIYVTTHAKK